MGTTLERMEAKFAELDAQMKLCKFAMRVQTLLDIADEKDKEAARLDDCGEGNTEAWRKADREYKEAKRGALSLFRNATKTFAVDAPEYQDCLFAWVRVWNRFCYFHNRYDYSLTYKFL